MGLTIETWSIAFRKRKDGLLDDCSDFRIIKNGHKGWYADPFLFEYHGETYLFAEFFSYKLRRGVIVYAKYHSDTGVFDDYKEIIREDYHLSYPIVYEYHGEIFMLPEANQSGALYCYKAVEFPEKWEKSAAVINDVHLVDTTPFVFDGIPYAFGVDISNSTKALLFLKYNGDTLDIIDRIDPCDMGISRPGGRVIDSGNRSVAVTQDCSDSYGKALNFIDLEVKEDKLFLSNILKRITPEQVRLINGKQPEGIHTYNFSQELEVIDIKYYKKSFYRIILKILSKIKS